MQCMVPVLRLARLLPTYKLQLRKNQLLRTTAKRMKNTFMYAWGEGVPNKSKVSEGILN